MCLQSIFANGIKPRKPLPCHRNIVNINHKQLQRESQGSVKPSVGHATDVAQFRHTTYLRPGTPKRISQNEHPGRNRGPPSRNGAEYRKTDVERISKTITITITIPCCPAVHRPPHCGRDRDVVHARDTASAAVARTRRRNPTTVTTTSTRATAHTAAHRDAAVEPSTINSALVDARAAPRSLRVYSMQRT